MRLSVRLCRSRPPLCLNAAAKVTARRGRFSLGGDSRSRRPAAARARASGDALAGPRVESGGEAGACSCRGLARMLPHNAPGPGQDPGSGICRVVRQARRTGPTRASPAPDRGPGPVRESAYRLARRGLACGGRARGAGADRGWRFLGEIGGRVGRGAEAREARGARNPRGAPRR